MVVNNINIEHAYNEALRFTKNHYENFPVVSLLIKSDLRKHVAVVYQFARMADDIADEGILTSEERINSLNNFEERLLNPNSDGENVFFWKALHNTILVKKIELNNFIKLLSAFKQDVEKKRYKSFAELLDYCERSANPVGRIILELHGITDPEAYKYSDKICTALQLTNFLQDIKIDFLKGRIYLPTNEMKKFSVSENIFSLNKNSSNFKKLIEFQLNRIDQLFLEGRNLIPMLPFRLKHQINWTIKGGRGILDKIKKMDFELLTQRPVFSKKELVKLLFF